MVPGTAFLHACRYLDSRGAPTPHLRTPHAGAARTYPHPACTQKVPGNKVFRIWQAGALDSGNKIAASAHGMGSGGLAVDAMAIGCLGVDRRVERFFSYLAISGAFFPRGRRGMRALSQGALPGPKALGAPPPSRL